MRMNGTSITHMFEIKEGTRRIEINVKRVVELSLVFTNMFFVSYFFLKLFRII